MFTKNDKFLHQPRLDWEINDPQHDPSPRENFVHNTPRHALPRSLDTFETQSTGEFIANNSLLGLPRGTTSVQEPYFQRGYNVGDLSPYDYNEDYKSQLSRITISSR